MRPRVTLCVSPNGNDRNPGTEAAPLATLAGARDAVRRVKQQNAQRCIEVLFRAGVYRFAETVVFGLQDSAAERYAVTYAAYPGEKPVFSSGRPVLGWTKLEREPDNLPAAAHGHVWVADVPAGLRSIRALFDGQTWLPRARGPRFNPPAPHKDADDCRTFTFPAGAMTRHMLVDAEISVVPRHGWIMNVLPLESIDEAACTARTKFPATYPMSTGSIWIENVLDVLTKPGHWAFDSRAGKLYLWPSRRPHQDAEPACGTGNLPASCGTGNLPASCGTRNLPASCGTGILPVSRSEHGPACPEPGRRDGPAATEGDSDKEPGGQRPGGNIVAPSLTEFIRVEGEINCDGPADRPVRGLVFRGITFTHAARYDWHGLTGLGLQHDWEQFDQPAAMLRFRGAEQCVVDACHFTNSGSSGLRFDLHAQHNRIINNDFDHLGGSGILLCGYGAGTKDVSHHNEVTNNCLHHLGLIYWASPAIFAWQSGRNHIAHNHVHDLSYAGLVVSVRTPTTVGDGTEECARTVREHEIAQITGGPKRVSGEVSVEDRPWFHARENCVEYNDIHGVMQRLGDGNAIYISAPGWDNVVRSNYIHDCPGATINAGIRCDDGRDPDFTVIEGNLICRIAGQANGIVTKGIAHIINNIVADLRGNDPWHGGLIAFANGPNNGSVVQRNILYSTSFGHRFHFGANLGGHEHPPLLRNAKADYNCYYNTHDRWGARLHIQTERTFGIEQHSILDDPLFEGPAKGDFRPKPESPVWKLGFVPLTVARAGLLPGIRRPSGKEVPVSSSTVERHGLSVARDDDATDLGLKI